MPCIYKYVITFDNGKAPCVDDGFLSLCICKPKIRKTAQLGDWIIATGSRSRISRVPKIVFAAKVTEIKTMEQYAIENEGRRDCIYHFDGLSLTHNGSQIHDDQKNQNKDISGRFCLISTQFWYFGKDAIELPEPLHGLYHQGRGHGKIRDEPIVEAANTYFSQKKCGVLGQPNHMLGF